MEELSSLKPENVFKYFGEISAIPRYTGNVEGITAYVESFCDSLGLFHKKDGTGNLLVKKEGTPGHKENPPVVLQTHLDMLPDRDQAYSLRFDPAGKPLDIAVMDDYVLARGTSLGADGGIGLAYILALLASSDIPHPPIEALLTVDEGKLMGGVRDFDPGWLKGRRMITFSSFNDREILTGAAGGRYVNCEVPVRYKEKRGTIYDIVICGLTGGHSGLEIDRYRGNANMLMGRLLHYLDIYMDYSLFYLKGGLHHNYIPREAKASIIIDGKDAEKLEDLIERFNEDLLREYKGIEDNLTIYCENKDEGVENALTGKTMQRLIFLLLTIPDGIEKMNPRFKNVVQTSANLGIMSLDQGRFILHISLRSLLSSEKHAMNDKIKFLTETIGGTYTIAINYHAWEYSDHSPIRDTVKGVYKELFNEEPGEILIHTELEAGVILDKIRDMDIISIGPLVKERNTLRERLCISSVAKIWELLKRVLEVC